MTEFRAIVAAVLLFEAVHQSGILTSRRTNSRELAWALGLGGVAGLGFLVFGTDPAFGGCLGALILLNGIRFRAGMVEPSCGLLERWRFVPAAVVFALTRDPAWTAFVFGVLLIDRRLVRWCLLRMSCGRTPFPISTEDVDYLVPPPIRVEPRPKERGTMLLDVIVGVAVISTVAMGAFTAVANRAARIRQLRESTTAREHAVSELERLGAVPFGELAARDGTEFSVPGAGDPGRIDIEFPENGLARIRVEAPRRGAKPVVIETIRTRRRP